jgi:biopolymer transport protein ExbD
VDGAVISLNSKGQVSFALPGFDENFQKAVILQVASLHKVNLTSTQEDAFKDLPYLSMNVQELPVFLNLTSQQKLKLAQQGAYNSLDSIQLTECVKTCRLLAQTMYGRPYLRFYLKIEPAVRAPRVERLISLLKTQGITRFSLLTKSKLR